MIADSKIARVKIVIRDGIEASSVHNENTITYFDNERNMIAIAVKWPISVKIENVEAK